MKTSPKILDGKWLAKQYRLKLQKQVEEHKEDLGRVPGLAVILVGEDPASQAYVARKEKVAALCGFETFNTKLAQEASFAEVQEAITACNNNDKVDGILLQLPLPSHLDANALISAIAPAKDADGLHPINQGKLIRGDADLLPCTPAGVMALIDLAYSDLELNDLFKEIPKASLAGKSAVVIGRSILVGKPISFLLLERNATVSMAHSKTKDLAGLAASADIIVAAVGVPHLVKKDWIKKGAVVIDVGINRTDAGALTGDVAFDEVSATCSAITPVPGGVGPMTVAMLMQNTFKAYLQNNCVG